MINLSFYVIFTFRVSCRDNNYSYKISDIYFRPKSGLITDVGAYERNPEELIALYKEKHIGLVRSITIDKHMIREYLSALNQSIRGSIATLNKIMIN